MTVTLLPHLACFIPFRVSAEAVTATFVVDAMRTAVVAVVAVLARAFAVVVVFAAQASLAPARTMSATDSAKAVRRRPKVVMRSRVRATV